MSTPATTLRLRPLDPEAEPAVVEQLHRGLVASWSTDQPHEPPPTLRSLHAELVTPLSTAPQTTLVAEDAGGRVAGSISVELPSDDNQHLAMLTVHVAARHRRSGAGQALWRAGLDAARADGRRSALAEAWEDTPKEAFLRSQGARCVQVNVHRQQRVQEVGPGRVASLRQEAESAATGYRLETWAGPTPPHLRADLAEALSSLDDAPRGGLDLGDEAWDAARVARRDAAIAATGQRLHGALALAPGGGSAGFSDLAVSEDGTFAWQWGSGVLPAHRGHRLGLLLKTRLLEHLWATEADLAVITTDNADDNPHMVAVNDLLGYLPVGRVREWQVPL